MDNGVDHPEENSELKQLLALGRARGYLTYGEINDHLPQDIVEAEQLESIVAMLTEMGIRVLDAPPDMEELLMSGETVTEDEAVEEAAAAMTAVEREGRTTDPVRMYMREMGTVELLTREGEIAIAKRIEVGQQQVVSALLQLPRALDEVFGLYDQVQAGQLRLSSFVAGFYESDEPLPPAVIELVEEAATDVDEVADDEAEIDGETAVVEEVEIGPDPEQVRMHFELLRGMREQIAKLQASKKPNPEQLGSLRDELLSNLLKLRIIPKQIEDLAGLLRGSDGANPSAGTGHPRPLRQQGRHAAQGFPARVHWPRNRHRLAGNPGQRQEEAQHAPETVHGRHPACAAQVG